jgi:hypothetical protein
MKGEVRRYFWERKVMKGEVRRYFLELEGCVW